MTDDINNSGINEPDNDEQKNNTLITKLRRSKTNKLLFGVCGGIGEYFKVDPIFVRLLFVLSLFMGGWGIAIYFILIFAIPHTEESNYEINTSGMNLKNLFGTFFIFAGIYLLFSKTQIFMFFTFFGLNKNIFIPLIFIGFAFALIISKVVSGKTNFQTKKLNRSLYDRKVSGVCGGFSSYFGIDSSIIRLLWSGFIVITLGAGIILYLLFALLVPPQKDYSFAEHI